MDTAEYVQNGPDTAGMRLATRRRWLADAVELLSSMRFAISLLTLIAIASMIGTVLRQNEPMPNYVNQFGPFWFEVFGKLSLYSLYSAWWFLLIMGFLVLSTSLCIARNTPKMLRDMRSWRDQVREQSLRNFHHKAEWRSQRERARLLPAFSAHLAQLGYRTRIVEKEQGTLLVAKCGAANKFGYIFAHSAIVVICLGGLLDSDLPIRFQQWFMGKVPFAGNGIIAQIPPQHRLPLANPSFRGNTLIPEGSSSNTAIIQQQEGVLIQDLPFTLTLNKFNIDYYASGMPKLFASDVVVRDHETGQSFPATIKVNQPLIYKGVAVYQSSFEDGGSRLQLTAYPMRGARAATFEMRGEVGASTALKGDDGQDYTIEWSGFRAINVENMEADKADSGAGLERHLGAAARTAHDQDLKNVGPSVQYKLRDRNGQAREFSNYMLPVQLDGASVLLAGTRDNPDEGFRYLRIPADDAGGVGEWMRLRAALADPALRQAAARRYAQRALPENKSGAPAALLQTQLGESAKKSLDIFAGNGETAGFVAISAFLEKIPAADQAKAADVFMKILNGSLWDLWMLARAQERLPELALDEKHGRFLQLATSALSDAFFYGAPVYLQLKGFDEVKASVLQVTRSPGKSTVYFGCLLLVLGVFAMFYVRERRVWIWLRDEPDGTDALMAFSSQRKTLDFEKEFAQLKQDLAQLSQG